MRRLIAYTFLTIIVSCFFFPFEFTFLPGVNLKMALAAIGLYMAVVTFARQRKNEFSRIFLGVVTGALLVSLVSFASCVLNNTNDFVYVTYIVSFAVWTSAAYACSRIIRLVHGNCTTNLIGNYLIAVCVMQCVLALFIDFSPVFKNIVDSYIVNIFDVSDEDRLYGIGASLDVAGTRFAAILLIITAFLKKNGQRMSTGRVFLYFSAFLFITIIGNMIARTTTVGVALSVLYLIVNWLFTNDSCKQRRVIRIGVLTLGLFSGIAVLFYFISPQFEANIRFAFEGFFSLAEKGRWETTSNDMLMNMWVWPDNLKTWIIGDGYMGGAAFDPNFIGDPKMINYYMNTDIGYCRFIFYFGVIGLIVFITFFALCAINCIYIDRRYRLLFMFFFLLNCLVWIKVTTDIFPVFAFYFCAEKCVENKE